jgi:hypothetical protein
MRMILFCVAILSFGCGASSVVQPTAPTPVPTSSSPFPPGATSGPASVSGFITETTTQGPRAIGGIPVNAWVQQDRWGYSYWWANGPRAADASGRYELGNLPDGSNVMLQIWKDGYVQQCAAPAFTAAGPLMLDLHLVPRTLVSADRSSVPAPAQGFRHVSGVVYENAVDGRRPVPGAFVDFEPVMDFPAAITYTDTQGRFLLCGLPDGTTAELGASLTTARVAYVNVPPHQTTMDIEIPPAR